MKFRKTWQTEKWTNVKLQNVWRACKHKERSC